MDHVEGQDRHQMMMYSLDQLVHPQAFVRIIDAFVDTLDLSSFDFSYFQLKAEGRPPYHPAYLLKLFLYGYQSGIRSCRKLEHACKVNVEVMWLLKGLTPHYKTIANFRKDNAQAFRLVFRHFVFILKDWKLVDGKHIAIDSFKVRAQNSLKNNFNEAKLNRHLDYIDQKLEEYENMLDEEDEPEQIQSIQLKMNRHIQHWDKYCDHLEHLYESGDDQVSTTDPDAKGVILHRNIVNVGYNIQAVSDAKHKLLIGIDTGSVNDTHQLSNMVHRAMDNVGMKRTSVLADKGYHTGAQIAACEELGSLTFVSPKANAANKKYNVFPMEDFKYHPGSDTYRCPNKQILRSNGEYYNRKSKSKEPIRYKHYKTRACKKCPLKQQCTSSQNGRVLQRTEYQSAIERNNDRVYKNPDYYRLRQQLIEHQFGTFKRHWHFDHVLMKGKEKVLGEISILFTAYNLRRAMSIFGFSALIGHIRTLYLCLFRNYSYTNALQASGDKQKLELYLVSGSVWIVK